MTFKQFKIKYRKMINTLLIILSIVYLISFCVDVIIVNNRVVLKTSVISKVKYAHHTGSRMIYDEYYLQNEDYYLNRMYTLFPSLHIIMERNKVHAGDEVSYYIDTAEIKRNEGRRIKYYTNIGITVGKDCPKKTWYWLTLLYYVHHHTILVTAFVFFMIICFYRPVTLAEKIYAWCMGLYLVIMSFIS
jgi:hypothetical protein